MEQCFIDTTMDPSVPKVTDNYLQYVHIAIQFNYRCLLYRQLLTSLSWNHLCFVITVILQYQILNPVIKVAVKLEYGRL